MCPPFDLLAPMRVEPDQELPDASGGQRDARVCRPIVQIDGVAVVAECVAARKRDIIDVAFALVGRLGTENPRISPGETDLRLVEFEESDSEAVETARRRMAHTVVDH